MATTYVSAGQIVIGATVANGDTLIVDAGGSVIGTTVTNGFLQLNSGASASQTTVNSSSGFLEVDAGAMSSGTILTAGYDLVMGGTDSNVTAGAGSYLIINSSGSVTGATVASGAFVDVGQSYTSSPGTLTNATINGGFVDIYSGGALITPTLLPRTTASIYSGGTISGPSLSATSSVDLGGVVYAAGGTAVLNAATDVLTIKEGGVTTLFQLAGTYANEHFTLNTDNGITGGRNPIPGTIVTVVADAACYRAGTLLLTGRGEYPIEYVRPGDVVMARSGPRRVTWVGHRDVDCDRHPRPRDVWPMRVSRGAFGERRPLRDLWLSPDHAVFFDDVLIPVRYLVNGRTIRQEACAAVSYWHVELDRHDVIFAEGLPAESYLDTGNRSAFADGGPVLQLHPDFAMEIWDRQGCARLIRGGAELQAVRSWLLHRARELGHEVTTQAGIAVGGATGPLVSDPDGRSRHCALGAGPIDILSDSAVPAEIREASDDHRRLGVAISALRVDGVAVALDDPRLTDGWHGIESDGVRSWRWTDGAARIALEGRALSFDVMMRSVYWTSSPAQREVAADAVAAMRLQGGVVGAAAVLRLGAACVEAAA